jgi:hypothetical protein
MATLQEVTDAITAFNLAQTTAATAQSTLETVEAAVNAALVSEAATFTAAQAVWTDQLQLARDAAGFPEAVAAVETAANELAVADSTLKALMAEYAAV